MFCRVPTKPYPGYFPLLIPYVIHFCEFCNTFNILKPYMTQHPLNICAVAMLYYAMPCPAILHHRVKACRNIPSHVKTHEMP